MFRGNLPVLVWNPRPNLKYVWFGDGQCNDRVMINARIHLKVDFAGKLNPRTRGALGRSCERPCPVPVFVRVAGTQKRMVWLKDMATLSVFGFALPFFHVKVCCSWSSRHYGMLPKVQRDYEDRNASSKTCTMHDRLREAYACFTLIRKGPVT